MPWSVSAWITISAPVISVIAGSTRLNWSVSISGIKKGLEGPRSRIATHSWAALTTPSDALPKYDNKIAHRHSLLAESCATLLVLRCGVKRKRPTNANLASFGGSENQYRKWR